ncbi:ATP-binding protein [Catenulispora pinisilvae]|uniref:ATP-binding protein n=1 Tax=Catenulispora pinisilvae TaxID=2705253 RepID=UPI0018922ACC|nr:ATP-binding protein [Catenulispora pinisilvae]
MEIWSKEFPGRSECLAEVRLFSFAVLGDCDAAHMVALVADELAGNAIKHTASGEPGGEFVVRLARFSDRCRVRVDDQGGPSIPAIRTPYEDDEAGRGLTIVATLSARWGTDGDETARSVWAEIAFDEAPAIPEPGGPAAGLPSQVGAKRGVGMTTDDGGKR